MRKEESLRLRKTVHDAFFKKDSQNEASCSISTLDRFCHAVDQVQRSRPLG
jgi:hypothetical protein